MHDNVPTRGVPGGFAMLCVVLARAAFAPASHAAELDLRKLFHESIPPSPFIAPVYEYASVTFSTSL